MGTSLFGLTPAATYPSLIKFGDNSAISGTLRALSDGLGTDLPIQVSTAGVNFTGTASIGGTAIVTNASGVSGAIQFSNGSAFASDAANLFWDDTNNRLGVGTNAPTSPLNIKGVTNTGTILVSLENSTRKIIDISDRGAITANAYNSANQTFSLGFYGSFDAGGLILNNSSNANGVLLAGAAGVENYILNNLGLGTITPGARLGIKGSGSTSATTSLLVQNSAGTSALTVTDDLVVTAPTFTTTTGGSSMSGATLQTGVIRAEFFNTPNNAYTTFQTSNANGNAFFYQSVSIGTGISPTARLQVKGSGSTSATTSLLVQNSAGAAAFQVKDNQQVQINLGSTLSDVATPNLTFSSTQTGIYSPNPNQLGIVCYANETARFIYGSSLHNGALNIGKFANPDNNAFFGWCSDGSLEITGNAQSVFVNPTNNSSLVIGASADLGARLGIKGSGSTSATTSLLVQNSAGTNALQIRDDRVTNFEVPVSINGWNIISSDAKIGITPYSSGLGTLFNSTTTNGASYLPCTFWISNFFIEGTGGTQIANSTGSIDASAKLQVDSTTKGFLPPRMTTTQKNAISSPAAGLVVYDNTTNKLNYNNGTVWKEVTPDGYTGMVTVNATPPVTFDIQNGIIVNVI